MSAVRKTVAVALVSLATLVGTQRTARAQTPGPSPAGSTAIATFAGGCFWCMEPPFESLDGVLSTQVGYSGGHRKDPTYEEVSAGTTGHAESVRIVYDPRKITYAQLLDVFWRNIDPLTPNAQFCDHGDQYRTAIFYHDETQRQQAEASRRVLEQTKRFQQPIVTEIVLATQFYPAEEHHQKYHQKNRTLYEYYRWRCGRDRRLAEVWGTAPSGREEQR